MKRRSIYLRNLSLLGIFFISLMTLVSCNQNTSPKPPAEYFGESIRVFSGQLENYTYGEAKLVAIPNPFVEEWFGEGKILGNGSFSFELPETVEDTYLFGRLSDFQDDYYTDNCNLQVTHPQTKYLMVIFIGALQNEKGFGVMVEATRLEASGLTWSEEPSIQTGDAIVYRSYADTEGSVTGSCSTYDEYTGSTFTQTYHLNYKPGWNLTVIEYKDIDPSTGAPKAMSISTRIPPEDCQWFFIASPEYHVLKTQEDVDALSEVTVIDGDLILEPTVILDLSPLNGLTKITGLLSLQNNPVQSSLSGFNALESVGYFQIHGNSDLNVISGFENLKTLIELGLSGNPTLSSISGFGDLQIIEGGFSIEENTALTSISSFSKLKTVGWLTFGANTSLSSLPNFEVLETINNGLNIFNNPALTSISGFDSLKTTGEWFGIMGNPSLSSISGFRSLETLNGLYIGANTALDSINGFDKLTASGIKGQSEISNNPIFNCSIAPQKDLPFLPINVSTGNQVNCPTTP